MGQDIHMWMEYRRPGQPWRMLRQSRCLMCGGAGELWMDQDHGEGRVTQETEDCWRCEGSGLCRLREEGEEGVDESSPYLYGGEVYSGRNYELFGALAPSGRVDERVFPPLVRDRGVPKDATPEFQRLVDEMRGDGHTHSWLDFNDVCAILVKETGLDRPVHHIDHMAVFRETTVVLMARIAAKRGPENVRLVFFFDN